MNVVARAWLSLSLLLAPLGCEERHAERCAPDCKARGACTSRGGKCVATDADDCRRAHACTESGRCHLVADECRATAAACSAFSGCKATGACGEKNGVCAPTSNAHCAPTEGCREEGLCTAHNGVCLARGDDCKASDVCTRFSKCTAEDGKCGTYGPADCALGELCKLNGLCTFVRDHCELTSRADCERTEGCRTSGTCTFVADTGKSGQSKTPGCVIGSDADCRQSLACKENKACRKGAPERLGRVTCVR
jgi:hypothetical protein